VKLVWFHCLQWEIWPCLFFVNASVWCYVLVVVIHKVASKCSPVTRVLVLCFSSDWTTAHKCMYSQMFRTWTVCYSRVFFLRYIFGIKVKDWVVAEFILYVESHWKSANSSCSFDGVLSMSTEGGEENICMKVSFSVKSDNLLLDLLRRF
jgi:hypothetical protein